MSNKEKKLSITMLGGFHMYYGDEEFRIKSGETSKPMHILQLLLYTAPQPVTTAHMIECLYAYDDILNPNNSLKASVSLLRRQLETTPLPGKDFISFHDRSYIWNPALTPEVDAHVFERLAHEAERTEGDEAIRLSYLACERYGGAFLPALIGIDWVEVQNIHYANLYTKLVRRLSELLLERGRIEDVLSLAREAYARLPSDEWLTIQMRCLMDLGRWDVAKRVYMDAVSTMARDYDVQPSAELLQSYREICANLSNHLASFNDVLNDIREASIVSGGYFCTFPGFIDSSRITMRTMARTGLSCFLMFISLSDASGLPIPSGPKLDEATSRLKDAVRTSLRRSDFFTQYNQSQYIVFLQGTSMENCAVVQRRIDSNFRSLSIRDTRLQFQCHTALLETLDELQNPEPFGWK